MRDVYAEILHRQPRRWDVWIAELAQALAEQCRQICPGLMDKSLRFTADEYAVIGRMLAQGFDLLVARNWPAEADERPVSLWPLDEAAVEAAVGRAERSCFEPMIRKYVEEVDQRPPARPHRDVQRLVAGLSGALRDLLMRRCREGGDLHGSLVDPLGGHGGYFADNGKEMDPAEGTGDPARDVSRLWLTIHADEDAVSLKQKLGHVGETDPWISQQLMVQMVVELAESEDQESDVRELIRVTDEFLFHATHLDGKTPIEILLERQPDMDAKVRERLERWDRDSFMGIFLVEAVEGSLLTVTDLQTDRRLRVGATRMKDMRRVRPGAVLATRVMPWEDHWLVSGAQDFYPSLNKRELADLRLRVKGQPFYRPSGMEDPRTEQAWRLQEQQYEAWRKLFGQELLLFDSGEEAQAAMKRFDRYWVHEVVVPETGMTRAQEYEKHGEPPPLLEAPLPEELLESDDVAVWFHRVQGVEFLEDYRLFQSAFEGEGPLSVEQEQVVWDYLTDEGVPPYVFETVKEHHPQRTEAVFRQVLRDEEFRLGRDLERVLRKHKGEQMRRPAMPMMTVTGDD